MQVEPSAAEEVHQVEDASDHLDQLEVLHVEAQALLDNLHVDFELRGEEARKRGGEEVKCQGGEEVRR